MAFSILSLNVYGLRDANKRSGLVQWLRSLPSSTDFVCLQETYCISEQEACSWFSSTGYCVVSSCGSLRSCGCIILYRPIYNLLKSHIDLEGRFLLCSFSFRDISFNISCLYAPNQNPARNDFFDGLADTIDLTFPTFICGDFNTVLDRSMDRFGSNVSDYSQESSQALAHLFYSCCTIDIWRYLHPTSKQFTWSARNGSLSSRIDLIGCPVAWVPSMSSCEILPFPFSDHCAVLLSGSFPSLIPPGPGVWKLNISILENDDYFELISSFWRSWKFRKSSFVSIMDWWELGKSKIKGLTVTYCKKRVAAQREKRNLLCNLVEHLKRKIDNGSTSCVDAYKNALVNLGKLDLEAANGARVRSRVQWAEEGETSSKYFLRLEKKNKAERWISALKDEDGIIHSDVDGISHVLSSFYSSLFSSEDTIPSAQAVLLNNLETSLPPEQSGLCDGPLSLSECHSCLLGMALRKAPGCDGLPVEFYLKFWDVLGADLVEVLNFCYLSGSLSRTQRRGLIALSFKKGDRLDPRNWRPISLLNVDYKIASRAIAGRLLKVIHLVVNSNQTCGVPGRYIGDSVAFLRDVVSYASLSGTPVAILSLDQEKAFDRVDWGFLRSTLVRMGFGSSFIGWVDLFYTGVQSAVKFNGYRSSFFCLSRGVRQGCPLSPLLYVLYAEVLACNIRANRRIIGLSLPGVSPLPVVSQYADDTSLIVVSDDSIKAVFDTYAVFELGSGSKLNLSKSKGLWLGGWSGRLDPPITLEWTSGMIKVLGVFIGIGDLEEANWRPRITAVKNTLNSWRQRHLSYRGRALIINALALSRIWYVASLVHMPDWVLRELNTLVFNFFWKGKKDLVTRSVVCQPFLFGGFSVVSIKFKVWALHVQWARRLVTCPASWVHFLYFYFWDCLGASPLDVLSRPSDFTLRSLPPFYRSFLSAWRAVDGGFSVSHGSFAIGCSSGLSISPVSTISTKSVYTFLLSENLSTPHCVVKFAPIFGSLYWSCTWRQLFLFDVDRPVIDLAWKIAHGVLYTADRLASFGYSLQLSCFCNSAPESIDHLFFECPLAQSVLSWLQSLMFRWSLLAPSLTVRHIRFGFSPDELSCVPKVFVYILNVCKFFVWLARNDYRFRNVRPSAVDVLANVRARIRFHLPIFFKRFRSPRRRRLFVRQWGACNVVASLVNDDLLVHV